METYLPEIKTTFGVTQSGCQLKPWHRGWFIKSFLTSGEGVIPFGFLIDSGDWDSSCISVQDILAIMFDYLQNLNNDSFLSEVIRNHPENSDSEVFFVDLSAEIPISIRPVDHFSWRFVRHYLPQMILNMDKAYYR